VTRLALPGLAAALALIGASALPAGAQTRPFTGYLQAVPLVSGPTPSTDGGAAGFSRFRISTEPVVGDVSFNVAYEHVATVQREDTFTGLGLDAVPGGAEWLELQWTIADTEHAVWRHRFDRLAIGWTPTRSVQLSVGRQVVSWGTTLFLTPADPFAPFDPADPFREFRAGVDAARLRVYPGALSEIDVVVRATKTTFGEKTAALARGLTTWRGWELSGWGGSLYGDAAGAVAATGALGRWAVRGEAVVRDRDRRAIFRGTIGLDRQFQIRDRDFYVVVEYQRDGLGAASPDGYFSLVHSDTFARGEHQVLGRDETVVQASYRVHPLWTLAVLWLSNLNDGSALVAPSVAYAASNEASISAGVFVGIGDDRVTASRPLPSEYGLAGTTAYISLSWFF